jgi:hypothetical protein
MEKPKQHQSATKSTTCSNKHTDMKNQIPTNIDRLFGRLLLLAGITFLTLPCLAQDKYDPEKDQGVQAVTEAQKKAQSNNLAQGMGAEAFIESARNVLEKKLRESGIKPGGWDDTKCRYAQVANYSFPLDNNDIEEYFLLRQLAALGAMVNAQKDLALWMGTKASMSVSVNNPGDPFKLENDQKLESIKQQLMAAKQKAEKLGARFDKSEEAAFKGLTTADRIKIASDSLLKKLDTNYDPSAVVDGKKKLADEVKSHLQLAKDEVSKLEEQFTNYQKLYAKRRTEASSQLTFDHNIFGMSALFWAENVTSDGMLQMAVAYVWSPKLAQSSYAALMGDASLAPEAAKGELSLEDWINAPEQQDLTKFGAFRYYVDNRGERWFLGASARAGGDDDAIEAANMSAMQNLYMPLASKLTGKQELKMRALDGVKKGTGSQAKEDLSEILNAKADANTRGLSRLVGRDVWWPAKSLDGNKDGRVQATVQIYALAASGAAAALKAGVTTALQMAQVEREKNRRWLEHQQNNDIVERAKKDTLPSRVPGIVKEQQEVGRNPNTVTQTTTNAPQAQGLKGKLVPQPGLKVTPGKVKEDF